MEYKHIWGLFFASGQWEDKVGSKPTDRNAFIILRKGLKTIFWPEYVLMGNQEI